MVVMTIMAHPDDAELSCGGTLLRWRAEGAHLVLVDLTAGQLGSRGSPARRYAESQIANRLLQPLSRLCLGWEDGFFSETPDALRAVMELIRRFRPHILITNALSDRHPDHGRAARLVQRAAFLAGLRRIHTAYPPFRPSLLLFAIQDQWMTPSLVVDITSYWQQKLQLIHSYESQFFHHPNDPDPPTYLTRPTFFPHLEARAREMGHFIGVEFGEGFVSKHPLALPPLKALFSTGGGP
ncbi:MAG: bacillithiol biosynthesis deacetylase BshB1 [Bacteroidia bacterium]|nr:bacillithiol biosynthesis deacetylase BshB1 [Bacteroidia bacterium]MDW8015303.1 bacillithiol biosynthesis deacetylase BshB1 [Bacteroidia bacterium]